MENEGVGQDTPRNEEYLRAHTIGELKPLSAPVVLVDYDPEWQHAFRNEAEMIRSAVGERALRIEHVGSTSVPNLPAKPVIGIVPVVSSSANEEEYAGALEKAGYQLRIPSIFPFVGQSTSGPIIFIETDSDSRRLADENA